MSLALKEVIRIGEQMLADAGVADAAIDAKELYCYMEGLDRTGLMMAWQRILQDNQCEAYFKLVEERASRVPLQHITGTQEFMGLPFTVNENVLIPRADTETLAEAAEKIIAERKNTTAPVRFLLDVCTGSGCIGISIAKRTGVPALLCDISPEAVSVAEKNIQLNGVGGLCMCRQGDLFEAALPFAKERASGFDIITINPPYICTDVIHSLQPEVLREPMIALDGGADGLEFYRRIRKGYSCLLNPGGVLLLETGFDQGAAVSELFANDGAVSVLSDICGNDRVVVVEKRLNRG